MEPTDFLELWQFAEKSAFEVPFELALSLLKDRALPCKVVEYVSYACDKGAKQTSTLVSELKDRLQPCVRAIVKQAEVDLHTSRGDNCEFWHRVATDCLLAIAKLAGSTCDEASQTEELLQSGLGQASSNTWDRWRHQRELRAHWRALQDSASQRANEVADTPLESLRNIVKVCKIKLTKQTKRTEKGYQLSKMLDDSPLSVDPKAIYCKGMYDSLVLMELVVKLRFLFGDASLSDEQLLLAELGDLIKVAEDNGRLFQFEKPMMKWADWGRDKYKQLRKDLHEHLAAWVVQLARDGSFPPKSVGILLSALDLAMHDLHLRIRRNVEAPDAVESDLGAPCLSAFATAYGDPSEKVCEKVFSDSGPFGSDSARPDDREKAVKRLLLGNGGVIAPEHEPDLVHKDSPLCVGTFWSVSVLLLSSPAPLSTKGSWVGGCDQRPPVGDAAKADLEVKDPDVCTLVVTNKVVDGFMSSITMHDVIIDQLSFLPQGALVRSDAGLGTGKYLQLAALRGLKWEKLIGDVKVELKARSELPNTPGVKSLKRFIEAKLAKGGSSAVVSQQDLSDWGLLSLLRSNDYIKVRTADGPAYMKPAEERLQYKLICTSVGFLERWMYCSCRYVRLTKYLLSPYTPCVKK